MGCRLSTVRDNEERNPENIWSADYTSNVCQSKIPGCKSVQSLKTGEAQEVRTQPRKVERGWKSGSAYVRHASRSKSTRKVRFVAGHSSRLQMEEMEALDVHTMLKASECGEEFKSHGILGN